MPKDIWTSISAFENAFGNDGTTGGCVRRWWFDKVVKLSKPTYAATRFGDVFHAVLARFYMADDRGLDATGKPVNLYPDGWKSIKSRFQKDDDVVLAEEQISDLDEALIRVLVDKAITEGVLVRIPGRLVEREITRPLYKDPLTGQKIVLKGFIDLETCRSVEDHKTAKDTKWLVTVNKLRNNVQMIVYAWDKYERGYEGLLWLTHNNFIKDYNDPQVIQRTVQVDKEYVYNYFNTVILPKFRMMLGIYQKYPASAVEKWRDLCPPNNPERECNHYYGHSCPYISICTGQCSVALYRAKYEDLQEQQTLNSERVANMGLVEEIKRRNALVNPAPVASPQASATPTPANTGPVAGTPVNPLDVLAKVRAMQAAQQQPVAAPVAPPVAQAAPGATVAATPVDNRPKAPWHYEGCVACRDNPYGGFNSQGSPCNICDAQNEQAGRLKSSDYSWVYDAQNNLVFTPNPGATPTFPEKAVETPAAPPAVIPPAPVEKVVKTRKPRTPKIQTAAPVAQQQVLIDFICPVCNRTYRYGKEDGAKGILCECQKAHLVPKLPTEPIPAQVQYDSTLTAANLPAPTPMSLAGLASRPLDVLADENLCFACKKTTGITLLIGCTFFKDGGAAVLSADDILAEAIRTIEQASGTDRTKIEHFALMSAIDAAIPEIAAELSEAGVWVTTFSPTKGTALARLVDGLRPFANKVIVNIGA